MSIKKMTLYGPGWNK